jgi:hypothetical protein
MRQLRTALLLLTCSIILIGCADVRAWERGYLARDEMTWDPDPLERALNDHIFFSKEASSGGNSAAGGGCGCN